jgi:hypothetical protein
MADDTTPTPAGTPEQQTPEPETGQPEDAESKGEKTVPLADLVKERKERQRLAKELEQVRTANLSEAEKAIAEAEKRGEASALSRVGSRLVDAELRLAAAGRTLTTDALLTFDRAKFLNDDGDVDREGLTTWVEQNSVTAGPPRFGDVDQGVRKTTPAPNNDERQTAKALFGASS